MTHRARSTSSIAPALAALLTLAACSEPPPGFVGEPELVMNPSGRAPLSGLLTFATDRPARATLTISDDEHRLTVTPREGYVTAHELMVLGLRPGRRNTVELVIEDADGRRGSSHLFTLDTPPLPEYLPPIEVRLSRPQAMEPGVTLLPLFRWYEQQTDNSYGAFLAIDAQGDVLWLYEHDEPIDEPRPLPNGNLLFQYNQPGGLIEIDMLGRTVRQWHAARLRDDAPEGSIPVDIDTFHHDVVVMPSGNFLSLTSEVRRFDDYPTDVVDPNAPRKPTDVVGDIVVEVASDGTVLRRWPLFDLVDPYRMGYGSLESGYWVDVYGDRYDAPPADWHHANGLHYDAASDSVLISTYEMSAVYKLDLASGTLGWILGDPTGWREPWSELLLEPEGELIWSYAHHAPEITPQGTLLLYDNGALRALPPNPPVATGEESFSRAVEYAIDEARGTVRQVWAFGGPGGEWFMSPFISEADSQPGTGNVLVTSGGHVTRVDGTVGLSPFEGHLWITLHEVTHTTPPEIVWEVVIDDPAVSWTAYRTERVPSLYPPTFDARITGN